ncbi:outer membrane protein assembly factor BamB family protein [Nonomuraea aridisoli]|uniref:Pyrrolo-quinoline quinone repeat domain-containing protein n=1 Tax=Nonomuraea aridisoli TaxID=2070368 RepID=A0A2W2DCF8_9ACTN|nr:PQQ-binding-like beta-propeller repeat protein [Nonomuraea aridisoli]PZG01619.1 hypothetical protein C1J01_47925 [Nonomuraea aridisoli]
MGLATLLAIGAGTAWFVSQSGEPTTPTPPQAKESAKTPERPVSQWQVPLIGAGGFDFTSGMGFATWLTDTTIIRVQKDGVLAYDLATGKRAWGTPSPGEQLCGATPDAHEGIAAIAYGDAGACDRLAGIDTATGKITWQQEIQAEQSTTSDTIQTPLIVSTDGLAILQIGDKVHAHNLTDGTVRWTATAPKNCSVRDTNAAPGRVVMLAHCVYPYTKDRVLVLDPETGKMTRKHPSRRIYSGTIASVNPIVTQIEDAYGTHFTRYDDSGKASEITVGKIDLLPLNDLITIRGMRLHYRVAVHGDRLYLATWPKKVPDSFRSRNNVLAYDFETGRRVWESSGNRPSRLAYIRADDSGLLALEVGDHRDLAPRLIRVDAKTGKAKGLGDLPLEFGLEAERAKVYEQNGAVIIVPWSSITADNAISYYKLPKTN